MKVAVIGAGVSGIHSAIVLQQQGCTVDILEKTSQIGGIWAQSYPKVGVQNVGTEYFFPCFPHSYTTRHPKAHELMEYFHRAVEHFHLKVFFDTEVINMEEGEDCWKLTTSLKCGPPVTRKYDYVIIATGLFGDKKQLDIPGRAQYQGEIIQSVFTMRHDNFFEGKSIVVVGNGKTSLDMATLAAEQGATATHVFRTARWMLPEYICGVCYSVLLFCRASTVLMPCWSYPTLLETALSSFRFILSGFWAFVGCLLWLAHRINLGLLCQHSAAVMQAFANTIPLHPLSSDLRSAFSVCPNPYFSLIAQQRIAPLLGTVSALTKHGVVVTNGSVSREIVADVVFVCVGSRKPRFPYLATKYRDLLEVPGGCQLYRHLIHPRIPRVGFAGFNHGFLHMPAVELGTLWLLALWRKEIVLPSLSDMETSMDYIMQWKRAHMTFEESMNAGVNTRFQQYLDVICLDLGLNPYRKMPNVLAEVFSKYGPSDYVGVQNEYDALRKDRVNRPRNVLKLHM